MFIAMPGALFSSAVVEKHWKAYSLKAYIIVRIDDIFTLLILISNIDKTPV